MPKRDRAHWRRRAMANWNEHAEGLPREYRLLYVKRLFGKTVHSWNQLSEAELMEVAVLLSVKRVVKSLEIIGELVEEHQERGQREAS